MEIKCNYTELDYDFFYTQVCALQGYLLHWFLSRAASLVLLLGGGIYHGSLWYTTWISRFFVSGSATLFCIGLQLEPLT